MSETEAGLERLVFGHAFQSDVIGHQDAEQAGTRGENFFSALAEDDDSFDLQALKDSDLFVTDIEPQNAPSPGQNNGQTGEKTKEASIYAWYDSDDERLQVCLSTHPRLRKLRRFEHETVVDGKDYISRLRAQYENLHPRPAWAYETNDYPSVDSNFTDLQPLKELLLKPSNMLRTGKMTASGSVVFQPGLIDMQRMPDVGDVQPSAITSLCFHTSAPIILTAGPSGLLMLHRIPRDGVKQEKAAASLHMKNNRGLKAQMTNHNNGAIFFSSRRGAHHAWDIGSGHISTYAGALMTEHGIDKDESFSICPSGSWLARYGWLRNGGGVVHLIDLASNRWVAEARVDSIGGIADIAWWDSGTGLTILGKGGQVVDYSLRSRQVVAKWTDEGAVSATVIAVGGQVLHDSNSMDGNYRWLAIGSASGIVHVYDRLHTTSSPKLIKYLEQLTTPISHLAFSADGQLLCMASRWKRDALRLVHMASISVYRNWPSSNTPLGRVTSIAWSTDALLAVGNEQGKVRLWEVKG